MKRINTVTIFTIFMSLVLCSGSNARIEKSKHFELSQNSRYTNEIPEILTLKLLETEKREASLNLNSKEPKEQKKLNAAKQYSNLIHPDQAEIRAVNSLKKVSNGYQLEHPLHTVIFSSEGLLFTPNHGGPCWHWQLTHIGDKEKGLAEVESSQLEPDYQKAVVISYMRGGIKEQYIMRQRSIEQQFVIPEPLELSGEDLVIEGRVKSPGVFNETEKGWLWTNDKGVVSLGDVHVYDAEGKEIAASMKVTAESTCITVNGKALAHAAYPVTIDPEVGTNDFRISDMGSTDGNTNYGAYRPAVAYNSTNNEYLVVWEGDDDTGSLVDGEFEIFGQRIDAVTGAEVGTDFRISDMGIWDGETNYEARNPAVAYNSTNNEYLVVWHGDDNTSPLVDDEFEIFGQRLNAATGAEVGTNDFRISDMGPNGNTNYGAYEPDVMYNSTNNEYLVVWEGDDNTGSLVDGEYEIFGQRLNAATGAEVGTNDFRISDMGSTDGDTNYEARNPAVTYNSTNNEYLVVWHGDDNTGSLVNDEYEIYYQRLNAATGAEVGTNDFRISDMGGTGDTTYNAYKPDVAYNSTYNEYMVVWEGDDDPVAQPTADDEIEIYYQRIDAATGSEVGINDFRISSNGPDGDPAYDGFTAQVAYNNIEDEWLVTWSGTDWSPLIVGEFEIHAQRFRGFDGWEIPPYDFRLSDMGGLEDENFDAYNPAIAFSSTEHQFLIVWEGDDNTGSLVDEEFEIFGQQWELTTLSTSAVVGSPFYVTPVADAAVNVPYTITGAFNAGNVFTAYLSDDSGDFTSEIAIGTRVATDEGTINALIPAGTTTGSGYRIRVKSSDPELTASDNGSDLTIVLFSNSIAPTATQNISAGADGTTLSVTESPAADSRQWKYSTTSGGPYTNDIAGATATTYTPSFASPGTYYVVCASTKGLATAISNEVQINVLVQAIDTGTIVGSPFLITASQGTSVSVPYTITGVFNAGNVFTAYLSDASGSFASGTAIGTRTATDGGTIDAFIPAGTPAGSGYRIRVNSSNPTLTGSDNGSDLTILLFSNSIAPAATQNISAGTDGTTLSVTESPAADSRQWKYSTTSGGPYTNDIAGATATTYTPNFAALGTYYVVCASTKSLVTVISNEVLINVGIPPTISITNPLADSYVQGIVNIQVSANDDVGISLVEFFIDDVKIGEGVISQPYTPENEDNTEKDGLSVDFTDAVTVFIDSEYRLRKIDAFGNVANVFNEDIEVLYLKKDPHGELIILFREPQLLNDGNHYSLILADPLNNALTGIDKNVLSLVINFSHSEGIQFDENEYMYYISSQEDGSVAIRKYMGSNRTVTLFRENIIIRNWAVQPDGTVIIRADRSSRESDGLILIDPEYGIIWLGDYSADLKRRILFPEGGDYADVFMESEDKSWVLFRYPEIIRNFVSGAVKGAGLLDSIQQIEHSSERIFIAGNRGGINRLVVCDPSENSFRDVLYDNIVISHLDVLENGDIYFSGFSPGENIYLAAACEYNASGLGSGDYNYRELARFTGKPFGFAALEPRGSFDQMNTESENYRAINAIYGFSWDTSTYSAGSYELKAVAHDTDGLTAEDSINVNVVKLSISLSASREIEQAWIIRKEYAKLEIDVENTEYIPVSRYVIYRKESGQTYSQIEEIPGSEIQDELYTYYDINIEESKTYTYQVIALDGNGVVIGISEEKDI